jgi:hypothetical protein
MGRPRKPTAVLEISGAFKKNPARKRARAAEPRISAGLGDPPEEWVKDAEINGRCKSLLNIWNQIVAQDQAALRVLNASHRMLVVKACQLTYKIDRAMMGYGKVTSGDFTTLKSYLTSMGQTPIDSNRVAEAVRVPDRDAGGPRRGGGWGELVG